MKTFIKAMDKHGFEYLREKFLKFSHAKSKEGIFIGLQIRNTINDLFEHLLTETEKSACLTFKAVCLNFLGNIKSENYKKLAEDLFNAYQIMGCNISLKIHRYAGKSLQNILADYCGNLTEEESIASYK
jgi:hypothetical protein